MMGLGAFVVFGALEAATKRRFEALEHELEIGRRQFQSALGDTQVRGTGPGAGSDGKEKEKEWCGQATHWGQMVAGDEYGALHGCSRRRVFRQGAEQALVREHDLPAHLPDGLSPTTASRCRHRLASELLVPTVGDHHVVLDANAAELA